MGAALLVSTSKVEDNCHYLSLMICDTCCYIAVTVSTVDYNTAAKTGCDPSTVFEPRACMAYSAYCFERSSVMFGQVLQSQSWGPLPQTRAALCCFHVLLAVSATQQCAPPTLPTHPMRPSAAHPTAPTEPCAQQHGRLLNTGRWANTGR
jgi:hypothetical protein